MWRLKLFLNMWRYSVAELHYSVIMKLIPCGLTLWRPSDMPLKCPVPRSMPFIKLDSISMLGMVTIPLPQVFMGIFCSVVSAGSSQGSLSPHPLDWSWLWSVHFPWTVIERGFLESEGGNMTHRRGLFLFSASGYSGLWNTNINSQLVIFWTSW